MSAQSPEIPDESYIGIEVLNGGFFTTIQDSGRPGFGDLGVGISGAADQRSMKLANRLVGNDEHLAVLEVAVGGLAMRAVANLTIALTGAACPITIGGRSEAVNSTICVRKGDIIELGIAQTGMRTYLAVRGGIQADTVFGSKSTDVMAQLGPEPIRDGRQLCIGRRPASFPNIDYAPVESVTDQDVTLDIVLGPREDWFTAEAKHMLVTKEFVVTSHSDRIGMRLEGPSLPRLRFDELYTEGTVAGSLQIPPSGKPTLFLADHPVTGGYPVIAVVVADDLHIASQLKPGSRLRFRESDSMKRAIQTIMSI